MHVHLRPTKIKIIYFYTQDSHAQSPSYPMMQVHHVIDTALILDTWQDKLYLIQTGVDVENIKVSARVIQWGNGWTMGTWVATTINVRLVSVEDKRFWIYCFLIMATYFADDYILHYAKYWIFVTEETTTTTTPVPGHYIFAYNYEMFL